MSQKAALQLFEERKVRTVWDDEEEKWYFSIVDVCGVLTDSKDALTARKYWNKLKQRLKDEGNETVTNCHPPCCTNCWRQTKNKLRNYRRNFPHHPVHPFT